ncbi:hypothetical protein C8Q80DRAFT_1355374 [Daedaleopsis nitida]|nr:hypothetical protein C8Q80DRAFT_1355374 [Daedaleopsis nitida]
MSRTTSIVALPVELHFAIIDRLRTNPATLRACALTCGLWTDYAQQKLFSNIYIDQNNMKAFRWVSDRRPDLTNYIREITLHNVDRIPPPTPTLRLTNVKIVRLIKMRTSNPWVSDVLEASKPCVEMLSLHNCYSDNFDQLLAFLKGMPKLKNIEIDRGSLGSDIAPVPFVGHPHLESLSLACGEVYEQASFGVVRALLANPAAFQDFSKLSILRIRVDSATLPAFDTFLGVVGPSLRELDFGMRSGETDPWGKRRELPPQPGFLHHTHSPQPRGEALSPKGAHDHLFYVPLLLDTLQAPRLRRVKLVVRALRARCENLYNIDWNGIDEVFEDERFKPLRRVLVHVVGGFGLRGQVIPFVEEGLPHLALSGTLRCRHQVGRVSGG